MTNTIGISFPLRPEHANRLLSMKEVVFLKYTPHETVPLKLEKDMYFFIYKSHADKEMVGRAKIVDFGLMDIEDVLEKYEDKLFVSKTELMIYARGRKKKVLVLVLDNIIKYEKPIRMDKPINMGGKYILEGDIKERDFND